MITAAKKIVDIISENEGRDKVILFLPYKVEMWDSMESVFNEFLVRGFRTFIQPIPYMYLDRNRKVSSLVMDNWDRHLMSFYGEIDKIRPDIVFIHYPFDSNNTLTTLNHEFYSANLKKKGCKLAYLSYHGNYAPTHEMLMPGVVNSDYVFAYDEDELQRYLSVWAEHEKTVKSKVFATGTPKLDAYIEAKNHPEKKHDSVLIINSLMPYLEDEGRRIKYINIIEKELSTGKEVIFRPHPLLADALKRTNLWSFQKYKEFLLLLELKGVTIDKNRHINSTLRRCSKIYSDPASLSVLCREAGFEVIDIT